MAKTELTDLPNEVLVEIFKALDAKTKLRLMRVCKNFKANLEVPTLWTEFSSLDVTNAYYDEMAEFQNQTRKSKRKSKATIQKDFRTRHLRIAGFAKGNIKSLEMTPLAIPHPSLHKASTRVLGQIATSNCTNITEMTVGIVSCASWLRELLPKMVALRSLTVTQAAIDAEIGSLIERGEEYELPVNIKRLKVLVWGVNLRPWTIKGSLETLQVCSIHGSRRPYQVHLGNIRVFAATLRVLELSDLITWKPPFMKDHFQLAELAGLQEFRAVRCSLKMLGPPPPSLQVTTIQSCKFD